MQNTSGEWSVIVYSSARNGSVLKTSSSPGHPRCRGVCFFTRFVSLHRCLSKGCSAVNGCRQNESLIKHHSTPVHQLTSGEDKRWNKSSIKMFWLMLSDGLECCDVFIRLSFWRHPFTAEHPLLRHWCRDKFLQTLWRNKLILILNGPRISIYIK